MEGARQGGFLNGEIALAKSPSTSGGRGGDWARVCVCWAQDGALPSLTKTGQLAQEQRLAHAAGPHHKEGLPAGHGKGEVLVDGPPADAAAQALHAQLRKRGLRVRAGGAHAQGRRPRGRRPRSAGGLQMGCARTEGTEISARQAVAAAAVTVPAIGSVVVVAARRLPDGTWGCIDHGLSQRLHRKQ